MSNVIYMEERTSVSPWRSIAVRDRRYSIRYPFAADAELLDLETGAETSGVTCDHFYRRHFRVRQQAP